MSPAGAVSRPVGNSGSPQARITLDQSPDSNQHEPYSTNDRVIGKVLLRFSEDTPFDSFKITFEGSHKHSQVLGLRMDTFMADWCQSLITVLYLDHLMVDGSASSGSSMPWTQHDHISFQRRTSLFPVQPTCSLSILSCPKDYCLTPARITLRMVALSLSTSSFLPPSGAFHNVVVEM